MAPRIAARPLQHSRSHDYKHLIRRWRAACRLRGLRLASYAEADGFPLFVAETRRPRPHVPWIYVSTGIHGDESAATEGALAWLSRTRLSFDSFNLLAFPCLNPWGLVNNSRLDAAGRDLNRTYHDASIQPTGAHLALLAGRRFDLALTLHEDYDADGIYIYEVKGSPSYLAEQLLDAARPHVPSDTRRNIEGRPARSGVVRRALDPGEMPFFPEAFTLHFHHARRTFTIETPSEFSIDTRVAAQIAVIDRAISLTLTQPPASSLSN